MQLHPLAPLKKVSNKSLLLVNEIYASVQGESTWAGQPCVFIRTTACHLRCTYCDTHHAFFEGKTQSLSEIMTQVKSYGIPLVELTGGEPLLQKASFQLLSLLCEEGFQVLLETSGAVSIHKVDKRVKVILDVKTPSSGEVHRNIWRNLDILWPGCEVKFVISDRKDYLFAKSICEQAHLYTRTQVLFSPEWQNMDKAALAQWMVQDRLPAKFQLQLHKVLWGNKQGV